MQLIGILTPGALLIVLGGALMNVAPALGAAAGLCGFVLLVALPVFSLGVALRCWYRRKRDQVIPPRLQKAEAAVDVIAAVSTMVVVPIAVLGGLGVYCLVTAGDDPDQRSFKLVVGVGALLLLAAFVHFLARGRPALMLRLAGVGLVVFGAGGLGMVLLVLGDGSPYLRDLLMLVASAGMLAAGLWLAATGRNTIGKT